MPIEDYALLSNLRTAALVSRMGSVDWLCLPRFDSAACFAALLGRPEHGRWLIAPSGETKSVERRYLPETLVLETTFETEDGVVRLVDFMPPDRDDTVLARIVEGLEGEVEISTELVLRFEYGSAVPWLRRQDHVWLAVVGPNAVRIESGIDLEGKDFTSVGSSDGLGGGAPAVRSHLVRLTWRSTRAGRRRRSARGDRAVLAGVVGPVRLQRRVGRARAHVAARAQRVDLRPDRGESSRRRPPRCRRRSAGRATGTTASAGSATPPSRSSR